MYLEEAETQTGSLNFLKKYNVHEQGVFYITCKICSGDMLKFDSSKFIQLAKHINIKVRPKKIVLEEILANHILP